MFCGHSVLALGGVLQTDTAERNHRGFPYRHLLHFRLFPGCRYVAIRVFPPYTRAEEYDHHRELGT